MGENIQDSLESVNPVFYSYLGFGLKAARLATLGALDTEGLSEYQLVVGDSAARLVPPLAFILWSKGYVDLGSVCCITDRKRLVLWCVFITSRVRAAGTGPVAARLKPPQCLVGTRTSLCQEIRSVQFAKWND